MKPTLVILTESGFSRGYGHLVRMSALYEEALTCFENCLFILDDQTLPALAPKETILMNWKDISNLDKQLQGIDHFNLVVDSYEISEDFCEKLTQRSQKTIFIDDNNRLSYPDKSWIVNPSPYGKDISYSSQQKEKLFSGVEYLILRDAFFSPKKEKMVPSKKSVFVLLGGTDPLGITPIVIKTLIALGYEPHTIKDAMATEVVSLMDQCSFGVIGGGQTLLETAVRKLPCFVIEIAENQRSNISFFKRKLLLLESFKAQDLLHSKISMEKWIFTYSQKQKIEERLENEFKEASKGKANILSLFL